MFCGFRKGCLESANEPGMCAHHPRHSVGREKERDCVDGRRLPRLAMLLLLARVTAAMTAAWGVGPASAQAEPIEATDAVEAPTADEQTATLNEEAYKGVEEIMVEARRRSQDLQKIGESVSSFSATDLLDQGLTDFNVLQYNVPSLFSGGGLTKITLRGVGSEIVGPGVDPGFAVHVNNVFSARETTGLIDFFDIERVDVMRGPQGTLWGRNSTGGRAQHHHQTAQA